MSESGSDTDSSSDDGDHFFEIITKGAKLAQIYSDLYLIKGPPKYQFKPEWTGYRRS